MNDSATVLTPGITIQSGTQAFIQDFRFPLRVGQEVAGLSDPMRLLEALKEGKCSIKEIDFHSHLDGAEVCKVLMDFGTGGQTCWIDMSRGAIPIRTEYTRDTRLTHIDVCRDIRFVAGAGWLPMTETIAMQDGKVVHQTRVTNVEVGRPPGPSAFRLDFPGEIGLYDDANKLTYSPRKSWSLIDLPRRGSPDATPTVPKSFVPPPEMPTELAAGNHWPVIFFAVALVLAVGVGARMLLKRYAAGTGA